MPSKTVKKLDKLLSHYFKDIIKQVVNMSLQEIEQIDKEDAERFYKKAKIRKTFYVDKETHDKWLKIPKSLKKRLHYLVNKKLQEVKHD
jgi:ribosomal protein S13